MIMAQWKEFSRMWGSRSEIISGVIRHCLHRIACPFDIGKRIILDPCVYSSETPRLDESVRLDATAQMRVLSSIRGKNLLRIAICNQQIVKKTYEYV